MAIRLRANHHYTQNAATVFTTFVDPAFVTAKYSAIGARDVSITEQSIGAEGGMLQSKREVPAEVPGALKRFLGAWNKITQTEKWQRQDDGGYACQFRVEIDGVPTKMQGTMHIQPKDDGGTVNEVVLTIDSSVPFVGKQLTKFVAGTSKDLISDEYKFSKAYLNENA